MLLGSFGFYENRCNKSLTYLMVVIVVFHMTFVSLEYNSVHFGSNTHSTHCFHLPVELFDCKIYSTEMHTLQENVSYTVLNIPVE